MAKVGLEFGDKLQIKDKKYTTLQEGLDIQALLGELTFRHIQGAVPFMEPDTTQPRNADGSYPEKATGEIRWVEVAVYSPAQSKTIFVSIVDMPLHAIKDLGLKLGDPVDLKDLVVTWSNVSNGTFKLFASAISKKGGNNQSKKQEHKDQNQG